MDAILGMILIVWVLGSFVFVMDVMPDAYHRWHKYPARKKLFVGFLFVVYALYIPVPFLAKWSGDAWDWLMSEGEPR